MLPYIWTFENLYLKNTSSKGSKVKFSCFHNRQETWITHTRIWCSAQLFSSEKKLQSILLQNIWIVLMLRRMSRTFVIAKEPVLPKSAANFKEGTIDWERTGMEISEMFHEMSKPYREKYIIVFKYFCSFIGLRFNLI